MKKAISLLFIAVLLFTFCSCGGKGTNGTINSAKIGQTITTNDYEITVIKVSFGTNLETLSSSENYLSDLGKDAPTKIGGYDKAYVASTGRAYAVVLYSLKYVGKSKTTYSGNKVKIQYGDGYTYSDIPYMNSPMIDAITHDSISSISFEPLSNEIKLYTVIDIPEIVMTDTTKPLSVIIFDKEWIVR